VTIAGTGLRIRGRIDRLDLSADHKHARVVDYKTGKPRDPGVLDGGAELQRCLYAWAVQALLGNDVIVEAALLYPRGKAANYFPLSDAGATLGVLTTALLRARDSLIAGHALPGPDAGDKFDAYAFALPAGPAALTARKQEAAKELLGDAAAIWEQV
jgi:RecB family exonuclease